MTDVPWMGWSESLAKWGAACSTSAYFTGSGLGSR